MTGTATAGPEEHPLLPGASPATIRSFLLPEDRPKFVASYETALEEARRTLDLTPVRRPWGAANPTGMRVVTFGDGRAVLVHEVVGHDRRVFLVSSVVA